MKTSVGIICGIGFCLMAMTVVAAASPELAGNPYREIVARNAFHLEAPPLPVPVLEPSPEITLNGLSAVFDKKFALFKADKKNYMLAEGERAGGIELLSVDLAARAVRMKVNGIVQIVMLSKAPDLPFRPALAATSPDGAVPGAFPVAAGSPADDRMVSGNGTAPISIASGVAFGQEQKDPANSGSSTGGTGNGDPVGAASAGNDQSTNRRYQYWVDGAREIERARLTTAPQVLAGTWQPYPRTPFTPPGTPSPLIGPDSVFMEHGPGLLIPGQ